MWEHLHVRVHVNGQEGDHGALQDVMEEQENNDWCLVAVVPHTYSYDVSHTYSYEKSISCTHFYDLFFRREAR